MTLPWADIALIVAIVVAGCGASYFLLLGRLRRVLADNQREMEHRLTALTEAIRGRTLLPPENATDALTTAEIESEVAFVPPPAPHDENAKVSNEHAPATEPEEEIAPEIRVAIAAAAIAALGNHARVHSARRVPSSDVVSPWTQQGRVIVQSSHNLRHPGSR